MALDDLADERQTEAGATARVVAETLEDVREHLGVDAWPFVANLEEDPAGVVSGFDLDGGTGRGVTEGVVDQVQEHALQERLGTPYPKSARRLPAKAPALLFGQ